MFLQRLYIENRDFTLYLGKKEYTKKTEKRIFQTKCNTYILLRLL